jgi:hypothetical protein|tara:strand:+ start:710 stop:925 length:216 start_codon:yes stop_codon:yes gene_type:complete
MSEYTTKDFVDAIASGDNVRSKDLLLDVLGSKIIDELETKKVEVASTMFNPDPPTKSPTDPKDEGESNEDV